VDGNKTNILPFNLHILQGVTTKTLRFDRTRRVYVFRMILTINSDSLPYTALTNPSFYPFKNEAQTALFKDPVRTAQ